MKDWLEQFSLREQLALLIMCALVIAYVVVLFVVRPLAEAREELSARNLATAAVLQRVDAMAAEIQSLRSTQNDGGAGSRVNLSASLNESAGRYLLRVSRLQPNSQGSVQLRFESAPLDALLPWIHELEMQQGMRVDDVSLSQTSTAGVVSATLRVASGQ